MASRVVDNWSRRQRYHVGAEISGRVGEILGRVGELFWTRRRNPWTRRRNILDASAKSLDASAKYFGYVGGVLVVSAAQDWSPRQGYHLGDKLF